MNDLPATWDLRPLAEVCQPAAKMDPVTTGRASVRYVDIGSVDGSTHKLLQVPEVDSATAPSRCRQVVHSGDTVFSTVRPYLEKIAFIDSSLDNEFASTGFCVLRPTPDLEPRFLFHFASSKGLLDQVLPMQKGVSYPAVLDREVRGCTIPVPPLPEQRRIVDILEGHLTSLDDARRSLDQALSRSTALVAKQLSATRRGALVRLPEVAEIQGGIQKQQKRAPRDNAYPFLRVANVTASGLDLRDVHRIEVLGDELDRLRLRKGDLLVVEGNGSPSQIGRAALWDGSIEDCVHQNHLIRLRAIQTRISPEYLEAVWNSPENRALLTDVSSSSSGLHTLSVSKLRRIEIPLPELTEQRDGVRALDAVRLAQRRLAQALSVASIRGAALRRAILAAAFSGQLTGRSSDTGIIESLADQEEAS